MTETLRQTDPPVLQRLTRSPVVSRHGWFVVFAVAAVLRIVYLLGGPLPFETRQTPIAGDAQFYYFAGRVLSDGSLGEFHTFIGNGIATRGPGYVLFLAALFRCFGKNPWVVRIAQAFLGTLSCVILCFVGRELASRRVGLVAGLLAAVYPSLILFTGHLMTEVLALFLLWLGFLFQVRGGRLGSSPWLIAAGSTISLAALTRPTLLVTIPFQVLGVALATHGATPRRRVAMVASFAGALLLPLLLWNGVSNAMFAAPTAGGSGLRIAAYLFLRATAPDARGWSADTVSFAPEDDLHFDMPLYRAFAALNLVFHHFWFLDNVWREVPPWMHGVQRVLFLLGLGGLGVAVVRGRRLAPLLALTASCVVASAKFIEIRPLLPLIPAQLLLASIFLEEVSESIATSPHRRQTLLLAVGGAVLIAALIAVRGPQHLAAVLPFLDAVALGLAGDALVVLCSVLAAWIFFRLCCPRLGSRRAALASLLAAGTFALLFASYAAVGSAPRWRAWEVDLALGGSLAQEIDLGKPLRREDIRSAIWFIDMRSETEPPPVRVGIDGIWLAPERYTWQRVFCNPNDELPESVSEVNMCSWYKGLSNFTGAFPGSPQWWSLRVAPELVAERREITLMLATAPAASSAHPVRIGGTFTREPEDRFYGPLLSGFTSQPATSIYKWHVTDDWRLWGTEPLASVRTRSLFEVPAELESGRTDPFLHLLGTAASRGQAHLNIRLLIESHRGRRALY